MLSCPLEVTVRPRPFCSNHPPHLQLAPPSRIGCKQSHFNSRSFCTCKNLRALAANRGNLSPVVSALPKSLSFNSFGFRRSEKEGVYPLPARQLGFRLAAKRTIRVLTSSFAILTKTTGCS